MAGRCGFSAIRRSCPPITATATPMAMWSRRGRHLVVSGGLGPGKLPVRLGVPPEIVLVDLLPRGLKAGGRDHALPVALKLRMPFASMMRDKWDLRAIRKSRRSCG